MKAAPIKVLSNAESTQEREMESILRKLRKLLRDVKLEHWDPTKHWDPIRNAPKMEVSKGEEREFIYYMV